MFLSYYISEIRQNLPLDWPSLDDRTIVRLINQFRTVYIKNHYTQNRTIDPGLYQSIVVEISPTDQSTVSYISTNFRILKSVYPIPKLVKLAHRFIVSVRNPKILSENYNFISKEDAIYAGAGKTNTKDIFVFIDHDSDYHLYIKLQKENPKIALIPQVVVQGIFEDPLECIPFQSTEDYVDFRDYEYPMTDTIWGYIKANILRDGLGIIQAEKNDGKEKEI